MVFIMHRFSMSNSLQMRFKMVECNSNKNLEDDTCLAHQAIQEYWKR